jgi:hypothetical protein
MRLKIGPISSLVSRILLTLSNPTPPTSTAPTSAVPVKADLSLSFGEIDPGSDPLTVQVVIPPYDLSAVNNLVSLTAIAIPFGSGKPSDANGYMASSHPKVTVQVAPALPAEPIPAPPVIGASVGTSPLALAAPVVVPTPVVDPVASSAYLPGPSGGTVTLAIPDVPNGKFEIQLIEAYDL